MNINSFTIDTTNMPTSAGVKTLEVKGDIGSKFMIVVAQAGNQKYYNFESDTFNVGHSPQNNLLVTMTKKFYNHSLFFADTDDGDFFVKIMPLENTTLRSGRAPVLSKKISKASADITVTFQTDSLTTAQYEHGAFTVVGFGNISSSNSFSITPFNISSDTYGYGFFPSPIANTIDERLFFYKATNTVDGATSSSTSVVLDDLTGITVGSMIYVVSSGSLTGTPTVTAIDTGSKTLTLSSAQSFADGITLTFRSYGKALIKELIDLEFSIEKYPTTTHNSVSTHIRESSTGSSATVTLKDTYGVSKGAIVTGYNINDGTTVTRVDTADAGGGGEDGVITISSAAITIAKTPIQFNTSTEINISGLATVNRFPSSNATVYLDLEKFITTGTDQ
tara:strand:+ start:12059 stop:13234 length:1176 start_codon:yes stop_codon:yes gene_type:complete